MGEYYGIVFSPNDWRLYHHGIKGQKWGVKNGPPYPLDSKISTGKRLKTTSSSSKKPKEGFVELLILFAPEILWTVSLTAMVADDAIKTSKAKKFIKQCDAEREAAKTDKKTGLKLKANPDMSQKEDAARVNPEFITNPSGARRNCTNCTIAYEMRRRGYEVQAKLKSNGRNGEEFAREIFGAKKAKKFDPYPNPKKDEDEFLRFINQKEPLANAGRNKELGRKTIEAMKQEPPGSRGQVCITWNRYGGHSMAYEITSNGKVNFIDGQTGKIHSERDSEKMLRHGVSAQYQRLDNCKTINTKKVKEAVR